jgi:hypothetical protein
LVQYTAPVVVIALYGALWIALHAVRHRSNWMILHCSPSPPAQTTDFYEIITERHRKASTVATSNRDASEWLPLMADPLLAQSAIDRLTSTCHELIVEGDSYRRCQRPAPPPVDDPASAPP